MAPKCLPLELLFEIVPFVPAENATPNALSSCRLLHKLLLPRVVKLKETKKEMAELRQLLKDEIGRLEKKMESEIGRLEKKMDRGFNELGKRISEVETKVEGMETKIGGMETKIGGMETKIGGMETKVERLETKMNLFEEARFRLPEQIGKKVTIRTNEVRAPHFSASDGAQHQRGPAPHTLFGSSLGQRRPTAGKSGSMSGQPPASRSDNRESRILTNVQFCQKDVTESTFKPGQPAHFLPPTVASSNQPIISRTFSAVVAAIPPTIVDAKLYHRPETLTWCSIELYWAPLNNCGTDHYIVEVKNKNKEWKATKHKLIHCAEKKTLVAQISKLEPNTVFSFRVKAYGENGRVIGILGGSGGSGGLTVRTLPRQTK
ncbi:hypothetical protein niasHT_039509 [Heterodera trifolii]|uniref:Fibronectin type-III domain-containing protein n=1 Tax=Heterodera trifolii TaxID=157864 RepID=A0ABD2IUC3_9BILA